MSAQELPRREILLGDALTRVKDLPDAGVDCVVTSPPYFRLRNYDHEGQIGLEAHVEQWVEELQQLLNELGRVLMPTGTIWLNLGDSYATHRREGAERKSLLLGPERLALRLIEDGWLVRNRIVWAKPNTVPSPVKDRLTASHEVIFVLAKQPKYFFDLDAIRVPHTSRPPKRKDPSGPGRRKPLPTWLGPNSNARHYSGLSALKAAGILGHPLGKNPGDVWTLSSSTFKGAHFATFPVTLAARMVQTGCPEARCVTCKRAYERPVRRLGAVATRLALKQMCECDDASEPGLVLDPFMGAGTTAIAAENLGRDWLGIELNPEYVALATERIAGDAAKRQQTSKETNERSNEGGDE